MNESRFSKARWWLACMIMTPGQLEMVEAGQTALVVHKARLRLDELRKRVLGQEAEPQRTSIDVVTSMNKRWKFTE